MRKDIKISSTFRPIKFVRDYTAGSRITTVSRWRYYSELIALRIKVAQVNNNVLSRSTIIYMYTDTL